MQNLHLLKILFRIYGRKLSKHVISILIYLRKKTRKISTTSQGSNLAHYLEIETLAKSLNLSLDSSTKSYPHLGQLKEKRIYHTLRMSSLYAVGGINGALNEPMYF